MEEIDPGYFLTNGLWYFIYPRVRLCFPKRALQWRLVSQHSLLNLQSNIQCYTYERSDRSVGSVTTSVYRVSIAPHCFWWYLCVNCNVGTIPDRIIRLDANLNGRCSSTRPALIENTWALATFENWWVLAPFINSLNNHLNLHYPLPKLTLTAKPLHSVADPPPHYPPPLLSQTVYKNIYINHLTSLFLILFVIIIRPYWHAGVPLSVLNIAWIVMKMWELSPNIHIK